MTSALSKHYQTAFAPTLKAAGFTKRGANWHRRVDGAVQVINLQGSQWGASFYLNLGVYFEALGDQARPPESACHLRSRCDQLVPDGERFHDLLDDAKRISEAERFAELAASVRSVALPWLDLVSTAEGARAYCERRSASLFIAKQAREYLGLIN
jgi:hypothetical protein